MWNLSRFSGIYHVSLESIMFFYIGI